jgi:hypothetical protein
VSAYDVGDVVILRARFLVNDVLTDPTTVDLRVRSPAGAESHPAVLRDGAGSFLAAAPITLSGLWRYRWVGTGAAAGAEEGFFEVRESSFPNP